MDAISNFDVFLYVKQTYCVKSKLRIEGWNNEFVQYGVEIQKLGNICGGIYM